MSDLLLLTELKRFNDVGVLLLRLTAGALFAWTVYGVLIPESGMRTFAAYLSRFHFPFPYLMARLSLYAQIFLALSFVTGFMTRWAGILCAVNFGVALVMVERLASARGTIPCACLLTLGIFFAFHGAGAFSLDALMENRGRRQFDA